VSWKKELHAKNYFLCEKYWMGCSSKKRGFLPSHSTKIHICQCSSNCDEWTFFLQGKNTKAMGGLNIWLDSLSDIRMVRDRPPPSTTARLKKFRKLLSAAGNKQVWTADPRIFPRKGMPFRGIRLRLRWNITFLEVIQYRHLHSIFGEEKQIIFRLPEK
jgi:hypothetical protein